jgi:hypothetical protein
VIVRAQALVDWLLGEYEPAVRTGGGAGAYACRPEEQDPALYGVADMACALFTVGALDRSAERRREWAAAFELFQDPATGHYVEGGPPSHVPLHVTAYAIAAMRLLDLAPVHPLRFAEPWRAPAAVTAFLERLDWRDWVYLESHAGAGLGSIFANVEGLGGPEWFAAYRSALDARLDPASGLHGIGKPAGGDLDQIGGTFHYAFLYEHFGWPLAHPEARTDAVLGLQRRDGVWDPANPWWLTLDAGYLLTRAHRASGGYRGSAVVEAVGRATAAVAERVLDPGGRREAFVEAPLGTHTLVAVLSLLAEAQAFLGVDVVRTDRRLTLVLDHRPFV